MLSLLFWTGLLGWLLFELLSVYFIMPFPGSQETETLDLAYGLYQWRYLIRAVLALMMLAGWWSLQGKRKWFAIAGIAVVAGIAAFIHFTMRADHMFLQPRNLVMKPATENKVDTERLVIGVALDGQEVEVEGLRRVVAGERGVVAVDGRIGAKNIVRKYRSCV